MKERDILFNRNTAIFYTCGTCNLRCHYCGIDKNPVLGEIDKALGESFKGDYYINQVKKYFPNRAQLRCIETWGGEPFWHMERLYPLVCQLADYYPYFDTFFSSTNFSYPAWLDKVTGLFEQFAKYPHRRFNVQIQLSVDGPEYINDASRGIGTTQKCLNNLHKILEWIPDNLPANIDLCMFTKGTLDNNSIRMLNDKEKIIEYYQFFENNFVDPIRALNMPNVTTTTAIPNTAVPSPVTKEDGQIFANVCKLCREIERENRTMHYFKHYEIITPYDMSFYGDDPNAVMLTYAHNNHTCGTCVHSIGFLPDNMISTCHEGFTQFAEKYQEYAAKSDRDEYSAITFDKFGADQNLKLCTTEENFPRIAKVMLNYYEPGTTARLGNFTVLIMALAEAGLIEDKYRDEQEALSGAIFVQNHTSYCVKDNYNQTGTFSMVPDGLLKLLLNGAREHIQQPHETLMSQTGGMNNGI